MVRTVSGDRAIGVNSWNEFTPSPDYDIEMLRVV